MAFNDGAARERWVNEDNLLLSACQSLTGNTRIRFIYLFIFLKSFHRCVYSSCQSVRRLPISQSTLRLFVHLFVCCVCQFGLSGLLIMRLITFQVELHQCFIPQGEHGD